MSVCPQDVSKILAMLSIMSNMKNKVTCTTFYLRYVLIFTMIRNNDKFTHTLSCANRFENS